MHGCCGRTSGGSVNGNAELTPRGLGAGAGMHAASLSVLLAAAVAVGALTGLAPAVGAGVAAALVGGAWVAASLSRRLLILVVALGATAVPSVLPQALEVAGKTVYAYELPLYAAVAAACWQARMVARVQLLPAICLLYVVLHGVLVGLTMGRPLDYIVLDARGLVVVIAAYIVCTFAADRGPSRAGLVAVKTSLVASAVLTTVAATSGLRLAGRVETAGLYLTSGGFSGAEAIRILTPATHVALTVACCCLALIVLEPRYASRVGVLLIPAGLIIALSFSRNSLLGVGVTLLTVMAASPSVRVVVRFGVAGVMLVLLVVAAGPRGGDSRDGSESGWFATQIDGYYERVVGGLSADTLALDSSTQARIKETRRLIMAAEAAPVFGHGFGFAYQPAAGARNSFAATTGRFYAHNFWLWLVVKSGVVGLLVVAAALLVPVVRALRSDDLLLRSFGATVTGLVAVSAVAPLPLGPESGGSISFGALLGILTHRLVAGAQARAGSPVSGD